MRPARRQRRPQRLPVAAVAALADAAAQTRRVSDHAARAGPRAAARRRDASWRLSAPGSRARARWTRGWPILATRRPTARSSLRAVLSDAFTSDLAAATGRRARRRRARAATTGAPRRPRAAGRDGDGRDRPRLQAVLDMLDEEAALANGRRARGARRSRRRSAPRSAPPRRGAAARSRRSRPGAPSGPLSRRLRRPASRSASSAPGGGGGREPARARAWAAESASEARPTAVEAARGARRVLRPRPRRHAFLARVAPGPRARAGGAARRRSSGERLRIGRARGIGLGLIHGQRAGVLRSRGAIRPRCARRGERRSACAG